MTADADLTFAFTPNASPVPVNERAEKLVNPGFGASSPITW